jgi:anti-sigma factor RsiW
MTNDNEARTEHPEELLAGYADGSASPDERRTVEAHLVSCSQCKDELVLAGTARVALTSLPELAAPVLTVADLEALPSAGPAQVADEVAAQREAKQARRQRQWKASWVALGGVAAVLALFAIVPLVLNRGSSLKQATGGAPRPAAAPNVEAAPYPQVRDRGIDYDQASIRVLAEQLAGNRRALAAAGSGATSSPAPSFASIPSGRVVDTNSSAVVQCAIRGAGLPADTVPFYLEIARFRSAPAYVVAVLTKGGSKSHVILYVVSQDGCAFLFEADQPL